MKPYGMMSNNDIVKAIKDKEMVIAGFDERKASTDERLTPAGFNFSFTNLIVSVNNKKPYTIRTEKDGQKKKRFYFILEPGDTALALTRESIWVSSGIAGTFHSKVSYVSKGLGHISTTLDPGWSGPLLISVNNPNKSPIKVYIAQEEDGKSRKYETFITLCLHRLIMEADVQKNDNTKARLEILQRIWNDDNKIGELNHRLSVSLKDLNLNESFRMRETDGEKLKADLRLFCKKHDEFLLDLENINPINEDMGRQGSNNG